MADKLASLSQVQKQQKIYTRTEDLPRIVRGLVRLDKWEMASFRVRQMKAAEICFDPP